MPLEEHLIIGQPTSHGRLPNPSLKTLLKEYSRAAVVYADPSEAKKPSSDLNKILALRPSIRTNLIKRNVDEFVDRKGYFAYGRTWSEQVQFFVFRPSGSTNQSFPSVSVTNAVSRLMHALSLEGYNSIRIEYLR